MSNEDLRYPIGKYYPPQDITKQIMEEWMAIIAALPTQLELAVKNKNVDKHDCQN